MNELCVMNDYVRKTLMTQKYTRYVICDFMQLTNVNKKTHNHDSSVRKREYKYVFEVQFHISVAK